MDLRLTPQVLAAYMARDAPLLWYGDESQADEFDVSDGTLDDEDEYDDGEDEWRVLVPADDDVDEIVREAEEEAPTPAMFFAMGARRPSFYP